MILGLFLFLVICGASKCSFFCNIQYFTFLVFVKAEGAGENLRNMSHFFILFE